MPFPSASRRLELGLFALALVLANAPLLAGRVFEPLLFVPSRVAAGEGWRVMTAPFAHVSLYHLLFDAGAFWLIYRGLAEASWRRRALVAAVSALGSLAVAVPALLRDGGSLCGLSGAAHGLLAFSAIEMLADADRATRRVGWASLLAVAGKSLLEAVTGNVLFASLHFGDIGAPVAICHLGGVLGGLSAALACRGASRPLRRAGKPFGMRWQGEAATPLSP